MKKALILSIAAMLIAAPVAQAQTRMDQRLPHAQIELKQGKTDYKKVQSHSLKKKFTGQKTKSRKHWAKGERMNDWKKYSAVKDYKRHGLRKPAQGQRWVKVDNDYLLVTIASGVIAGIIAAR